MKILLVFGLVAVAWIWMHQPKDATPQQRISAMQAQVAQVVQSAPAYAKAIKAAVVQVNQSQSAAVQHSQAVVSSPNPISPQLQAWLTDVAESQLAERERLWSQNQTR